MIRLARDFATEEALRCSFETHFIPSLITKITYSQTRSARESVCSDGHADLVWAGFHATTAKRDVFHNSCAALQDSAASVIVRHLNSLQVATTERIASETWLSVGYVARHLNHLAEADAVVRCDAGWKLNQRFSIPRCEIVAFEFKLFAWKRAIVQASRYRAFANRVYVVMPLSSVHRAVAHLEFFQAANVGLIGHSSEGGFQFFLRPRKHRPDSQSSHLRAIAWLMSQP